VSLLGDRARDSAEAELAVSVNKVFFGVVLLSPAKGDERKDADKETAEGGKTGADDGNVDLDDGPDGNLELDVTLVWGVPVMADEEFKTDNTDDGRTRDASV
jgi:hypothetical protein